MSSPCPACSKANPADAAFEWPLPGEELPTERIVARAPHVGLDMRNAQPQDYPGRALVHLLSGDPMAYTAKSVFVPDYVKQHGLGG